MTDRTDTRGDEIRTLARRVGITLSDEDVSFALGLDELGRVPLARATQELEIDDLPAGASHE